MKIVITGGTGFIGLRLARRLLARGTLTGPAGRPEPIDTITLFDAAVPPQRPADLLDGTRPDSIQILSGDIADAATVTRLIDRDDIGVFHLASVLSGGGEQDFDRALRVNLTGGLHLFEALRARACCPRLVFASSIAVFGGHRMAPVVGDDAKQMPQTTYGMTKACCELLINDYSRKGFLDGRSARLPTVIIRPGRPNAAASSFVSGVFREPLNGIDCALPVEPETVMPLLGYRAIVDGLIALYEADGDAIGDDRAVSLPSLTVSVQEMIDALHRVAGDRPLGSVTVAPDPFIQQIVAGWPLDHAYDRAHALGLPRENSLDEIVRYYIDDYVNGQG